MTIRWQIIQIGGILAEGEPKSDAGQRQVAFDKQTAQEFLAHNARQNTERLQAVGHWHDSGFVFTTETGQRLNPADVTEQFHWL
ncbi:hypothetical protein [Actinomadura sp. DC4]|uniref:hypothetical protein n=1 Tax=Actinomadura sp. DC4 TaxID=3055069 RepID=UPI0025B1C71B|nr:hypothetical protein [Actinomadura sp. DC4]MDN3360133.1 hypothetical protein [Actinomadura sp. DC4]